MALFCKGGGVGGTLLLQLLLILLAFGVNYVSGIHATGQCVQFGQGNTNYKRYDLWKASTGTTYNGLDFGERNGYWTIGTKKFDTTHIFLDNSVNKFGFDERYPNCPYLSTTNIDDIYNPKKNSSMWMNPCPGDEVKINTYAVLQDGVMMRGWLHFEIELTAYPKDEIMGIYVQIRDEHFNAIGEFLLHENEQCPHNTKGLATPSPYQIFPCSAVGLREAKLANALFLAQESFLKNKTAGGPYLSKVEPKKGIAFTWKLSEYWCNRHLRIRPEAIIITKAMVTRNIYMPCHKCKCCVSPPYRKTAEYWIHPGWFGAADIKKKNTRLDCSKKVIDYQTGKFTEDKPGSGKNFASWFLPPFKSSSSTEENRPLKSQLTNDYIYQKNTDVETIGIALVSIKSCQASVRRSRTRAFPSFSGRCDHHYQKNPGHNVLQGCKVDGDAPEFQNLPFEFEKYTEYVKTLTVNRTNLCTVPCNAPTLADLDAIKGYNDTSGESGFVVQKVFNTESRNEARVEKLWLGRKYHAVLCTIWTMFICPVGIFLARYYKETAMDRMCSGIHAWWWVHVSTAVAAYCMFLSSIAGIWSSLGTWGRSTHPWGYQHRVNGYISMAAFSLMIILGGFRAGRDPSRKLMRIAFMFMHSLCGFTIYFSNMFAIMMSTWIPASPSLEECDDEGNSASTSLVFIMSVTWLVVDLGFHIVMTTLYLMVDRRVHITRPWYCPIVPIMPSDSTSDLPGSSVRKIMFLVYLGASFIMMIVTVGIISSHDLSQRCKELTGPNDCEGDEMDKIYGCSSYVKSYLKYVAAATAINETGTYATA